MKKNILVALVLLMSATLSANAQKKSAKKSKTNTPVEVKVEKPSDALVDSVNYANGVAATRGLNSYLKQQLGVNDLHMEDFKRGFEEALGHGTDPKFVAYASGFQIALQLLRQIEPSVEGQFADTDLEFRNVEFEKGFLAGALNDTTVFTAERAAEYTEGQLAASKERVSAPYIKANVDWLAENAKQKGVVVLPSGLQYKVITKGKGAVAVKGDNVTVRYEGKMIDGTVFDSSYTRTPDTTSFKPEQVIKGWTEALCMMPEGSKWELYIPQELAYGERNAGQIKPYSTLIFTVEVVKVEHK